MPVIKESMYNSFPFEIFKLKVSVELSSQSFTNATNGEFQLRPNLMFSTEDERSFVIIRKVAELGSQLHSMSLISPAPQVRVRYELDNEYAPKYEVTFYAQHSRGAEVFKMVVGIGLTFVLSISLAVSGNDGSRGVLSAISTVFPVPTGLVEDASTNLLGLGIAACNYTVDREDRNEAAFYGVASATLLMTLCYHAISLSGRMLLSGEDIDGADFGDQVAFATVDGYGVAAVNTAIPIMCGIVFGVGTDAAFRYGLDNGLVSNETMQGFSCNASTVSTIGMVILWVPILLYCSNRWREYSDIIGAIHASSLAKDEMDPKRRAFCPSSAPYDTKDPRAALLHDNLATIVECGQEDVDAPLKTNKKGNKVTQWRQHIGLANVWDSTINKRFLELKLGPDHTDRRALTSSWPETHPIRLLIYLALVGFLILLLSALSQMWLVFGPFFFLARNSRR